MAVLRGHSGGVNSAQFSANGLYVVTASFQDRTVRLWTAQSGRQMAILVSPDEENKRPAPTRATFNADGTRVVIVSFKQDPRVVRVFPTPEDLIDFAKQTVSRELIACERRRFFLPVEGDAERLSKLIKAVFSAMADKVDFGSGTDLGMWRP